MNDGFPPTVAPRRAPVRPRVVLPTSGDVVPLEDEVRSLLDGGARGVVVVFGPPGSGTTTALAHLAAAFEGRPELVCFDGLDPWSVDELSERDLSIVSFAGVPRNSGSVIRTVGLAPWGEDEVLEYLMAVHPAACASVHARLRPHFAGSGLFRGLPEILVPVLDRMADDSGLADPAAALEAFLGTLDAPERRRALGSFFLPWLRKDVRPDREQLEPRNWPGTSEALLRFGRLRPVQILLATECVLGCLDSPDRDARLAEPFPGELIDAAGKRLPAHPHAFARLARIVSGPARESHPMAASLLHAAGVGWRPEGGSIRDGAGERTPASPDLDRARLPGAVWPGCQFRMLSAREADLRGADLSHGRFGQACLTGAEFAGGKLTDVMAGRLFAEEIRASAADLSRLHAVRAVFLRADLTGATLADAVLPGARFGAATLRRADLRRAYLRGADFDRADLDGADLSDADLGFASLIELRLRFARLDGANFGMARLVLADLEGVRLVKARFTKAKLNGALLSGSVLHRASFAGADLREAGLADVDWRGADLGGADVRGATFHPGSSRSGIVGSLLASEGTRTGFYTDDSEEQRFKSPDEIRKADLRAADLRGAKIDGVDFYLVDLRGARLDPGQIDHLRRCRAILGEDLQSAG